MTKLLSLRNKPVRLSWCSLWYTKAASFADNFACSLTLLLLPLSLIPPARDENQAPIHNRWRTCRITCQISPQATSSFETGRGRFSALRQICKCLEAEMVSPYKDKTRGWTQPFQKHKQTKWQNRYCCNQGERAVFSTTKLLLIHHPAKEFKKLRGLKWNQIQSKPIKLKKI